MTIVRIQVPPALLGLAQLAQALEAVERGGRRVDADQYRVLVQRVTALLQPALTHPGLGELLRHFPALAALYENLNYGAAGLCRSPLEAAAAAEAATQTLLQRLRQPR